MKCSTHSQLEDTEDTAFINTVRNKFLRRVLALLKSCVIIFLCRPDITVRTAVTKLGNPHAVGIIGSQGSRDQVVAFNYQRQGGHCSHKGSQSQNSNQNSLIHTDLWHWLDNYCVPRSKMGIKPTKS